MSEPIAFVTGYHAGRCIVQPVNPALCFAPGTALYCANVDVSPETGNIDTSQKHVREIAKREREQQIRDEAIRECSESPVKVLAAINNWAIRIHGPEVAESIRVILDTVRIETLALIGTPPGSKG